MASLIQMTKGVLIERIVRHINNNFPGQDFKISTNEVLLYIDQSLAYIMIGQVYEGAKVTGNLVVNEAWYTTYTLSTLAQDTPSGYWYSTLPQPPVSLPLGYSISRVYAAEAGSGQSQDFLPIKIKRVAYRKYMPMPVGARYWVTGSKIWMAMSDGSSLYPYTVYVEMVKTRTESLTETLNMPDDAIEAIFQGTVKTILQRWNIPQDEVLDNLPAGNKTS